MVLPARQKQRAGACCIPYKKSYKCDGLCDTCEFRCIPKDAPQHLSIDTEMESACEQASPAPASCGQWADHGDRYRLLILNGLLSELQASGPGKLRDPHGHCGRLSERAGAERLHMPWNTFVYKRNQLLKRLKENSKNLSANPSFPVQMGH